MVTLTEHAISRIHELLQNSQDSPGKALRLYVEGGGCAGFQYGFMFDEKKADDTVIPHDGFEIVIDSMSGMYLMGLQIDYAEDLNGAGFKFTNPNSTGSCGCGKSFAV